MDNELTPQEKVRLQLERSLAHDARVKSDKQKLFESAIKPVWIGENGTIKVLGQEPTTAFNSMPNLHYGAGEEMRPIPVGAGGRMSADNKSYLPVPTPQAAPPKPEKSKKNTYIITHDVRAADPDTGMVAEVVYTVSGTTDSPSSYTETGTYYTSTNSGFSFVTNFTLTPSTTRYATGFISIDSMEFVDATITTCVMKLTVNGVPQTQTIAVVAGVLDAATFPVDNSYAVPITLTMLLEIVSVA